MGVVSCIGFISVCSLRCADSKLPGPAQCHRAQPPRCPDRHCDHNGGRPGGQGHNWLLHHRKTMSHIYIHGVTWRVCLPDLGAGARAWRTPAKTASAAAASGKRHRAPGPAASGFELLERAGGETP